MYRANVYWVVVVSLVLLCTRAYCDVCVSNSDFVIQSVNQQLEVSGAAVSIKGINWWGAETGTFSPGGLNTRTLNDLLNFMKDNGFNGIRLPFALDTALNPTRRFPNAINYGINPDLQGLTTIEVFDKIFAGAASRGIVILLDLHMFTPLQRSPAGLWYINDAVCENTPDGDCRGYSPDDVKTGWGYMVGRYQSYWNFMGVDLINEPHDPARWANGKPDTDWAIGAADIGNYIIANYPNWHGLIFVEGVELNPNCEILGFPGCETCYYDGHWWGGNFEGVRCDIVHLSDQTRLVYSPHLYASSVFHQAYFDEPDFPNNLDYIMHTHFGFVMNATGRAIVVGEWGGPYSGIDAVIQDAQSAYFRQAGIASSFYWAINPNPGGDTDGVLTDDWQAARPEKLSLLSRTHPTPTVFASTGDHVCITTGDYTPPTNSPYPTTPPTLTPTKAPGQPTAAPTAKPTTKPTVAPTKPPTPAPGQPTAAPTSPPTLAPTPAPGEPTSEPTSEPTAEPTETPTTAPGEPTLTPTSPPTPAPGEPTPVPTQPATLTPTLAPTPAPGAPTNPPTSAPTPAPGEPTPLPTLAPTQYPGEHTNPPVTNFPTNSQATLAPTPLPTIPFTNIPTLPTPASTPTTPANTPTTPSNTPTTPSNTPAPTSSPTVSPTTPSGVGEDSTTTGSATSIHISLCDVICVIFVMLSVII